MCFACMMIATLVTGASSVFAALVAVVRRSRRAAAMLAVEAGTDAGIERR